MTNNIDSAVSPDTQAILLLCGYFGGGQDGVPLKTAEYNKVARWLHQSKRRPADLLQPDAKEWLQEFPADGKIDWFRLTQLLTRGISLGFEREKWSKQGIWIISRADSAYPENMRRKLGATAPVLLYGVGNQDLLKRQGVAVVGGRDADAEALEFARQVASHSVADRFCVISGGARGIDQEAVSTALEINGSAVVILAEGVAKIALSKAYRPHLSAGRLVLISPFVPQARWNAGNAMGRNKLVYALSELTVVASSGLEGGTWEGANENLKFNWVPVLVRNEGIVPSGNRALIERGAIPCNYEILTNLGAFVGIAQAESKSPVVAEAGEVVVEVASSTSVRSPKPGSKDTVATTISDYSDFTANSDQRSVKPDSDELKEIAHDNAALVSNSVGELAEMAEQTLSDKGHSPGVITDIFQVVWPLLADAFNVQVTESDLSELGAKYNIQNSQLKAWLTRAVGEGMVKKLSKPVRYQNMQLTAS